MFKCGVGTETGSHAVLVGLQFAVYKDNLTPDPPASLPELQVCATIPSFMGAGYGMRTIALTHVGSAVVLNLDFQAPEL